MTDAQLRYLAHQENVRHNQATEADATARTDETMRSNRMREEQTGLQILETQRSNAAREELERLAQAETHRANLVREKQGAVKLALDGTKIVVDTYNKGMDRATRLITELL